MSGLPLVLVIGAHREELAFGERVAEGLPAELVEVYRIPEGISGLRPRQDQAFRYRTFHEEFYLQLRQQLKGRFRVLIDLHAGLDAHGPLADLFCRDRRLLDCMRGAGRRCDGGPAWDPERVRTISLVSDEGTRVSGTDDKAGGAFGKALIPRSVWAGDAPLYVALELYIRQPGEGDSADWALARDLIRGIADCHSPTRP